jgi:hypothetical protein
MMTCSSGNLNTKSKSPLPDVPNVEMVYDTSSETTTRAAHGGLLLEELRFSTHEYNEHGGLHGSDRQSVIPYAHGESCCITVY